MSRLQETYNELKQLQKEKKDLNAMLKDELSATQRYQELGEEMKKLREERKSIENEVKATAIKDAHRLDDLKIEIASLQELLSDLALNMYIANEPVEITDDSNQKWVPFFNVKFKKD